MRAPLPPNFKKPLMATLEFRWFLIAAIVGISAMGVIAFEIGFKDATGHFDLWYQDRFSHEHNAGKDYFALSKRISLWSDGTITTSAPV